MLTLREVFAAHQFFGVIHFAGLKAVGESVAKPLLYYNNNVSGTIVLLEVMAEHNLAKTLCFRPLLLFTAILKLYLSMRLHRVLVPILMDKANLLLSIS